MNRRQILQAPLLALPVCTGATIAYPWTEYGLRRDFTIGPNLEAAPNEGDISLNYKTGKFHRYDGSRWVLEQS